MSISRPASSALARVIAAIVFAAAAAAVGCAGRSGYGTASAPQSNVLRIAMTAEPTTLDPALVQDGPTIDLLQQIYEGLVQWTPQNTLAPALATGWSVGDHGLIYTFHLRPGVRFQSGAPLTAEDVVFSFARSLNPALKSPVALTYMSDISGAAAYAAGTAHTLAGVSASGPETVRITLVKAEPYWLDTLTYPTAYILNPAAVGNNPTAAVTASDTDGTGAFKLTRYVQGSYIDLASNPNYWGGAPKIAGQHRPILLDANTRHSEYLAGQLDMVDESQGALEADEANPQLKAQVHLWPRAATYYVSFGEIAEPIFRDVRVRRAFAYATNKQMIDRVVFDDQRVVAQDILPQGIPGWSATFRGIPYDPAKARSLLAAAGYPGGKGFPTLPMAYRASMPDLAKTVDLLREMYRQNLGVTIQPRATEWTTLIAEEDNKALPIYHMRWMADYLDPQDWYSLLYRTGAPENNTGYSNPEFDRIVDAADVEQNPVKRAAMYRKAARIIADTVPMVPLYYQKDAELIRPYVHGIDDSLMGNLPYKHVYFSR